MKSIAKLITGSALLVPFTVAAAEQQRPNIVFFLIDDYGWVDSQVAYGEEVYPHNTRFNTPNMQRLANQGTILCNAYACPVSTPTRTSMLSGMNAAHSKITNWTSVTKDTPSDATGGATAMEAGGKTVVSPTDALSRPEWNINGMSPVDGISYSQYVTPLPQLLKDAGYFTVHVGKGHWASIGTPGASPHNMGFVVNVAGNVAGMPRSYQSEENYGNIPEKWNMLAVQNMTQYYGTGVHLTEALTREALQTLDYPIAHNEPFYLYMAHYATHTPIQADKRFYKKYLDAGMDKGQAKYASMVEGVDKSLGDIMDYLEKKGVADNTIIILMADNGGNSENKQKGGVLHTQNLPLREGKGSCYEGGIRVPLAFSWKGHVSPGTRLSTPVTCEDMFPTILEMAGVKDPKVVQPVDGKSLVKLITDGSKYAADAVASGKVTNQKEATNMVLPESVTGLDPERPIVMHYPHKWKPYDLEDIDFLSSMRKGDWKVVYRMATGDLELYNLKEDIGERNNLAGNKKYAKKLKSMADEFSGILTAWDAPMPVVRETGKPVVMPAAVLKK